MTRLQDIKKFYELMDKLELKVGPKRILDQCNGRMPWPDRGIYFFFEPGEERTTSGTGPRITRVGTHALSSKSKITLWKKLLQHKGCSKTGGGLHRASVFRKLVGLSLINQREDLSSETWGKGSSTPREIRLQELAIEREVSKIIRFMPFLWLEVDDEPSKESKRAYLEKNMIALLSNWNKEPVDPASDNWLGRYCPVEKVKESGLWNDRHVDSDYDPLFLDILETYIHSDHQKTRLS
jgi:hypothetical protein